MLPTEPAQKLSAEINVELVGSQEVCGQHEQGIACPDSGYSIWVTQNTDDVGKSTEALMPKRGLFTTIPHIEARGFYQELRKVLLGKDVIKGEIWGKRIADIACSCADFETWHPLDTYRVAQMGYLRIGAK
jgi:hypothetical protein